MSSRRRPPETHTRSVTTKVGCVCCWNGVERVEKRDGGEAVKARILSNHAGAIDGAKSAVHATCHLAPGSDVTPLTPQLYISCHA